MVPERSKETPLSNPRQGESSHRHHSDPEDNRSATYGVDYTPGIHDKSSPNDNVEDDRGILHEFKWQLYEGLPDAMQEGIEANLLKRIILKSGGASYDACATCLKNQGDVRALLLEGWKNGTFQALRSHPTFARLSAPAAHEKDTKALLSSHEPKDLCREEFIATNNATSEMNEPCKALERTRGQASTQMDEEEEEDMDIGNNYSDYVHPHGSSGKTDVSKLNISHSKFTAGRDIRVAVSLWKTTLSSESFTKIGRYTLLKLDEGGENQKIAEWFFNVVDYRAMHNEIAKKRMASTGEWLLRSKAYGEWFTSSQQRIMWCPGIPGVGKTVMASLVVDHLRTLDESYIFVGVIYFHYKFRGQQNKRAILEAICRQMFELRENTALKGLYDSHEKQKSRPTEAELRSALCSAFREYQACYLILDAFDEYTAHYSDKQFHEIIKDILSLGENLKLLTTSRVLGEMEATFQELGAIREEIVADGVDMRVYVAERVESLKAMFDFELSSEFSSHIVKKVVEAAKGRFLVAELSVNLLADQLNLGDLIDALHKLPEDIDETYIRVMELIKSYPENQREIAMKALQWIACAQKRLSVRELQHALATKHGRADINEYVTPLSTITGLCAGLIVVGYDEGDTEFDVCDEYGGVGVVRFVHFTTQEFFGRTQSDYFRHAHKEMFLTCIKYLSIAADCTPSGSLPWGDNYDTYHSLRHPFYNYAAKNWGHHVNTHHEMLHEEVVEYLSRNDRALELSWDYILRALNGSDYNYHSDTPKTTGAGAFLATYHHQLHALHSLLDQMDATPRTKGQRTPMHIAVREGWTNPVKEMMRWSRLNCTSDDSSIVVDSDGAHLNSAMVHRFGNDIAFMENLRDIYGRTPISYAAEKDEETIVKLLLESRGTDVNSKDNEGQTPLSYAARKGINSVAKLLLEHGAEVDSKDNSGRTPLLFAVASSSFLPNGHHKTIIKLLLKHGNVDVNAKDNEGQTPFWSALCLGKESIVRLLLEHGGVDVNSQLNGRVPFLYAAQRGRASTMRLLLEHRVTELDTRDDRGRTPCSYVAEQGMDTIFNLLLDHRDVEMDSKDNWGRTPLSYAVEKGKESIAKLLVENRGVDVNSKDTKDRTPLSYAAGKGEEPLVKFLLEHCAEVDSKDKDGRTPLSYAAGEGMDSVVRLLLEHKGVDRDSKDSRGRTPFSYAAQAGKESTIRLLLEHEGVAPDSKDNSGRTPFSYAASRGGITTVKLLLEQGVEVDSNDSDGRTPLSYAAQRDWQSTPTVELLLNYVAVNPDSKDNWGRTPLSYAAQGGHESTKLLLERGVQVDSQDNNGRTPLSYAMEEGNDLVIKHLLDHGDVDVNSKDNSGLTPFMYAVKSISQKRGGPSVRPLFFRSWNMGGYWERKTIDAHFCGVVQLLLKHGGVEVTSKDNKGRTALCHAVGAGKASGIEIIKLLLEHREVDVNSKDNNGRTPLSYAAEKGLISILKLLLEHRDLDVNSKDKNGRTPLSYAAGKGLKLTLGLLLENGGVDVNLKDNNDRTPLFFAAKAGWYVIVKLLLERGGVEVDSKDRNGRTAFSYAAQHGRETTVRLLLEQPGVKVNSKDNDGHTPFTFAAYAGKEGIIKILLDHEGVDLDSRNDRGRTPLSYAAQQGHESIIELLLARGGIEVDSRDDFGWSPLRYAAKMGKVSIVKLLRAHGAIDV